MRAVFVITVACAISSFALAAYCATRMPIFKHPTDVALDRINLKFIDRSRFGELELRDLDRQSSIILSNEKVKDRAWSELWTVASIGFLGLSLANISVAVLNRPGF